MLNQIEVFNSVEVLAPGIELDDVDSMLNSGEFSHLYRFCKHWFILHIYLENELVGLCHHHVLLWSIIKALC